VVVRESYDPTTLEAVLHELLQKEDVYDIQYSKCVSINGAEVWSALVLIGDKPWWRRLRRK
jgi:hypothetical protein